MRKDRNFLFNMIILYLSEISVSVNTCLKNKLKQLLQHYPKSLILHYTRLNAVTP